LFQASLVSDIDLFRNVASVPIGSITTPHKPLMPMQVSKKTTDPADAVLREIEEMGKKSFIPSIGPVKGKILAEIVRKHKPRKILEVGSLYGYSAILIAKNSPANAEITTVEKNPEHARKTEQNIERAKLESQIKIIQGDAMQILSTLPGPFDLVFLDAEKTQYLDYLKAVENKLHQGSVVVADNVGVFQDQMQNYLHYVRNTGRYRSRTVDTLLEFSDTTKDAIEISEKRY
jgi:predicted O-methyltransferase YrrM